MRRGIGVCFLVFGVVASAFPQCELKVARLTPCDANGNPAELKLGDAVYGVRVDWTVTGRANGPYNVKFSMADRNWVWKNVNAVVPGDYYGYATFAMPLDGEIPFSVTLDCDKQSGNTNPRTAYASGHFSPLLGEKTIEFFAPKSWVASQSMSVQIPERSNIANISYMFGRPTSGTSQEVLSDPVFPGLEEIKTKPFGYPILRMRASNPGPGPTQLSRSFEVRASNVRANLAEAMGSWKAYEHLPSEIEAYLKPESIVQSVHPSVKAFVDSVLPINFRKSMSPYTVAKTLFMACAARLTYETPASSDAVSGLTKGRGDCGTYSSLYDASLRSVGIPARNVSGWRAGRDQWHAWSEMYVPGAGWLPQDVTDCNSLWKATQSAGGYAYCFATIPDLNSRVVVSRGSTFTTEQGTWVTMQPGQWGVWGENVVFPTWSSSCSLVAK